MYYLRIRFPRKTHKSKPRIMFEHKIMRNQELMANWQRSLKKAIETNRYDSRYNVIDRALRGGTPRYDGLPNRVCNSSPDTASAPPARAAVTTSGSRLSNIIKFHGS